MAEFQNGIPGIMGTVLFKRVDKIIGLIPDEFPKRREIVRLLADSRDAIRTTPPDAMQNRWDEVNRILEREFPSPIRADWAKKIMRTLSAPFNLTLSRRKSVK